MKIRLMGSEEEIQWFENLLKEHEEIEILYTSKPYANRNDNGKRVYIDLQRRVFK